MEAMNVGSSFMHDDTIEAWEEYEDIDEEGEGLIEPRPHGRLANYTIAEDKLLCKTWLTIGMDPTTGTDQTKDTYLMRMKVYFDANNTSGNERSMLSLRSRWSGINTNCKKWAGVQANVDVINPSGTNEMDRLSNSTTMLTIWLILDGYGYCSYGSSILFCLLCRTLWLKACLEMWERRTRKATRFLASHSPCIIAMKC
jgi:hypothetical protein